MNYIRLFEIILDFIHEYDLPQPMSVNAFLGDDDYNAVTLMMNGRNDAPTDVSAEFLWETGDNGITTADVLFDGVHVTVQIFENNEEAA